MNWVQINIQVNEELDVWKFTYLDLRTLLRYFNFIPLKNLDFGLFFCTSSGQTTRCPDNFHTSDLLYSKIYVTCSGLYYHKILNGQYKPKLVPYALCFVLLEVQKWWIPMIWVFCACHFTETLGTNNYCLN